MFPFLHACNKSTEVARNLLHVTLHARRTEGKWAQHAAGSLFWGTSHEESARGAIPASAQCGKIRSTKRYKNAEFLRPGKDVWLLPAIWLHQVFPFSGMDKKNPSLSCSMSINEQEIGPLGARTTWWEPSMARWALWRQQYCPTTASTSRTRWATYDPPRPLPTIYVSQKQVRWRAGECSKRTPKYRFPGPRSRATFL